MFKNYLKIIACVLFFLSCKDKQPFEFNRKLIDKISKESLEFPSNYNSIILFCKCKKNKVALTYVKELRGVYKYKYDNMNFHEFLANALNQKLDISYKDKIECLEINTKIKSIYEKCTFDEFLNLYCEKSTSKQSYRIKKNISENQLKTVLYYFYINNYLATFDDYIGRYYITKADLLDGSEMLK